MKNHLRPFLISLRPDPKFEPADVSACFDVINNPLTEILLMDDIERRISDLIEFEPDSIVLTSSVASEILLKQAGASFVSGLRNIFCVGFATGRPLSDFTTLIPEKGNRTTAGLAELIISMRENAGRTAVFRSSKGNPELMKALLDSGIETQEFTAYTVRPTDTTSLGRLLGTAGCRGVISTSPMEAEMLAGYLNGPGRSLDLKEIKFFAIGNPTRNALEQKGISVSEPLGSSEFNSLIIEIRKKYCSHSGEWI